MKKRALNILGQIRLYSIVDLIFFSLALGSNNYLFAGIILLHLGFIFYLENIHRHSNRVGIPQPVWIILTVLGIFYFRNVAVIGFLVFSFLYAHKNKKYLGPYSPLFRGLQYYFLAAGVLGFGHLLAFMAMGLIIIRNFTGDLRDIVKDKKENIRTLPIFFGLRKNVKYLHIILIFITTLVWWYFSGVSLTWLVAAYIIQIATYNITAR